MQKGGVSQEEFTGMVADLVAKCKNPNDHDASEVKRQSNSGDAK